MTRVKFYDNDYMPARGLVYSVIAVRHNRQWIFVRHHDRSTWEIPGGHIEVNESPDDAARRELIEETGAEEFTLSCVATYSVEKSGNTRYGRLYFAEVTKLADLPSNSEIAETTLMDGLPGNLTYPDIQPVLFSRVLEFLGLL
ncbi:MAG: NUDIX domain-containing protein [Bacteroidota bacterium]